MLPTSSEPTSPVSCPASVRAILSGQSVSKISFCCLVECKATPDVRICSGEAVLRPWRANGVSYSHVVEAGAVWRDAAGIGGRCQPEDGPDVVVDTRVSQSSICWILRPEPSSRDAAGGPVSSGRQDRVVVLATRKVLNPLCEWRDTGSSRASAGLRTADRRLPAKERAP